ncbi:MAG: DUF302 domain-containing protein [Gammaproteobacteria bacterium]|nr:DUF302 domain-containing protein [Gammaproteobacteria bacterium]
MRYARNALAVIGALLLIAAYSIYSKGHDLTREMDARAKRALGHFIVEVKDADVARALMIRKPVAAGIDPASAEQAIRQRAKELDLAVVGVRRHSLGTGGAVLKVVAFDFCNEQTLGAVLELRPELGALFPCSLVLVSEPDGQGWMAMLDPELLLYGGGPRDPALDTRILSIKDRMLDAMAAAAALKSPGN